MPSIILVNPQMGENIGAAARAMLNFGLTDLRVVAPRDGWPNQKAIDMAAGALDVMEVRIFDSLAAAAADLNYLYATTARARDIEKPALDLRAAASDSHTRTAHNQKTGFVFGPERTGLENDDIALCHALLHIPTNPNFSSINLAQAVLLAAYEIALCDGLSITAPLLSPPATIKTSEAMMERLITALEDGHFFKTDHQKPTMIRNIRAMFTRTGWSEQEMRTFQGMITTLSRNE